MTDTPRRYPPNLPHRPGAEDGDLALLARGNLSPLGVMPRASNSTFLAEVCAKDRRVLAIYKPRSGETPLWDFPHGTLCRREVAAWELSRALGWPSVPPTVLRDGPMGIGAVQLFVEPAGGDHYFTLRESFPEVFRAVAAFDVVANNADRKSGHCLQDSAGRVWAIDHGVCFAIEPKLRTVIWEYAGEPIPAELTRDLERVAQELRRGELRDRLANLLSRAEVDATAERVGALLDAGAYPFPLPGRPYPWPPV